MNLKLLNEFQKKFGKHEKIIIYQSHITYCFKNKRWVSIDTTGEMAWDGKRNFFNTTSK